MRNINSVTVTVLFCIIQSQSAWFLPWLAQQSAELMFGVGFFIAYSLTGVNFSVQQGWE